MVKVTNTAFSRLKHKLRRQPDGTSVRLTVEDGHVTFRPGTEQKGDVVFAHRGHSILVMAADTADRISTRTLDVVKTIDGARLRFVRSV